jgi:hypothetical protein
MNSLPIGEYGLLLECRSAALVSRAKLMCRVALTAMVDGGMSLCPKLA